ncbi:MAG: ferredoxin, partial [Rikenellaceae bacterium]
ACIHRCPVQAIEWGKVTQTKGRYHHPELKN